jgi:hypothetical protein
MDEIDRIFRLLVETIRSQEPELLARPFEVADLYQSLLPYRLHRRELALETNSDYEMAMLRLLSGERGYLVGDDEMQEALRRELATPNPDPGAFRAYAMSHVSIAADAVRRLDQVPVRDAAPTSAASPAAPPRAAQPPAGPVAQRPSSPAASASPVIAPMRSSVSSPSLQNTMAAPPRSTTAEALGGRCRYCSGALPQGRKLTYCPHCGQNLMVQHCPACNTELEVGWKFCTTCGRGVQPAG